jgi:uroporphyrinogen decarboxylase
MSAKVSPRERVNVALSHRSPDRLPVDFLAVPEIWDLLGKRLGIERQPPDESHFFDPAWEEILRRLEVDCRVISYDQFCAPPESAFAAGGRTEWWRVMSRSTPARMWRWVGEDGVATELFGRRFRVQANELGSYEENMPALAAAQSLAEVQSHRWPDPDWWDFKPIKSVIREMNRDQPCHVRFRMGSVFEVAWQLRGMETFLPEMAADPAIPAYMMERITDILAEVTRRLLEEAGDDIDMVYFYDDVGSNQSLLISKKMWRALIRPCHQKLIDVAKKRGKQVMYHTDGAVRPLIPDFIEMGVDVLNPIQPGAAGMEPAALKRDFGAQISFHGGVDIVGLLPKASPAAIRSAVRQLAADLGEDGGYIMAGSHHIQCDTPLDNILALYDVCNR